MIVPLRRHRRGLDAAQITDAAAAVDARVAVENLPPVAATRHADDIVLSHHRREVAYHQHAVLGLAAMAQETDHAFFPVVEVHPAETVAGKVLLVECRFRTVAAVQIAHPALQAGMQWILHDLPFQAFSVLPFAALSAPVSYT